MKPSMTSLPQPFHLLSKPTGATCNLDCKYCFFLSKEMLYPGDRFRMSDQMLETYIRQLLEAQPADEVNVAWQGGEPTLMGLDFFRRSVEYVEKYRKTGQRILHTMQTNGTLLNDEWCAFFKEHNFLIGLSVDGPREMHDAYRVNKGGAGSFDQVMRGWETLRRHEVDVNILCTVHAANADHPLEVYRFFRDKLQAGYMQFIPIVERTTQEFLSLANLGWGEQPGADRPLYTQRGGLVTERSVGAEQFGRFLIAVFDEWVRRDVGKVFVQTFDVALGSWLGQHSLCIFSPTCGGALALEHNGDLYSCDHYVEPGYLLGNILQTPMAELVGSEKQRAFGQDKLNSLPKYCRECEVRFACHGECPRNRFITTPDGEPGLNYLCAGYKLFFNHIDPAMKVMASLLRQGRWADEIMQLPSTQASEGFVTGTNSLVCAGVVTPVEGLSPKTLLDFPGGKTMKRSPIALLIFVFLAAAIGVRAQENPLPEAYTGVAQGTGGSVGGKSIHFDFRITQYTTDEDVQKFAQLVKDQGTDALRRVLEKEDKGRLAVTGSTGNQIAIARKRTQGADTVITIITARNMPFIELYNNGRTTDYPFGYLQVKLDAQGKGGGQIMAAAKIRFDKKKGQYQIESFGNQYIKAVNVRPNK